MEIKKGNESVLTLDDLIAIHQDCQQRLARGWKHRRKEDLDAYGREASKIWERDLRGFLGAVEYELFRRQKGVM